MPVAPLHRPGVVRSRLSNNSRPASPPGPRAALALGGGSAPPGCNPKANSSGANDFCYFNVDPTNASAAATQKGLEDAIGAIRGQLATCTLRIDPTDAGAIDPGKVNVVVNGV